MARIVFDLDGTLIDSAPDILGVANGVLASLGAGEITLAQTHSFIGNGVDVFVSKMRATFGLPDALHAAMLAEFKQGYLSAVDLTQPYDGVVTVLDSLRASGHTLGICTNKPLSPCHVILDHLDLSRLFDTVIGGDSLTVAKPDPAPLHAALDAMGSGDAIYIGDSEVDAQTAQRAQVPFALFTRGYRKGPVADMPHDAAFDDFAALPGIVDQLIS